MHLRIIYKALKRVFIPCFFILVTCFGLVLSWGDTAQASTDAGAVVKERAEQEFDSKAGAGSANQIQGKVQEELGRAQRQLGSEAKGTAREMRGKVQKNIGEAQETAENAAEDAGNLVDKVKDFFD